MQLYPDDLWKRDPTRHPSFPIPDRRDVPLWRYLSGTRFRWLVENQRLYMPRIEQLTSNDAREATMPDAQAEFWKELIEKSENKCQLLFFGPAGVGDQQRGTRCIREARQA